MDTGDGEMLGAKQLKRECLQTGKLSMFTPSGLAHVNLCLEPFPQKKTLRSQSVLSGHPWGTGSMHQPLKFIHMFPNNFVMVATRRRRPDHCSTGVGARNFSNCCRLCQSWFACHKIYPNLPDKHVKHLGASRPWKPRARLFTNIFRESAWLARSRVSPPEQALGVGL